MPLTGQPDEVAPALAELAKRLLARNDVLAAELARRVASAESELADGAIIPLEDVEDACATLQGAFYRYLSGVAPLDLTAVGALGRRRADQGVPLPAVLHGFRIGFQFIWETLAAAADPDDRPAMDDLLGQVTQFWAMLDVYSTELRRSYDEAVTARVRLVEAERNAHIDALLGITAADISRQRAGAEALGLPRHGRFQIGIIDAAPPPSVALWESRLARHGIRAVWRARGDHLVCLAVLATYGSDHDLLDVLPGDLDARIGLSPAFDDVTTAGPERYRAVIALRSVPDSLPGIRRYGDDPIATLVASAADRAAELTGRIIGPIMQLPENERTVLLQTLQAWMEAAGSTDAAARALYCHRNTVRYRLRRIEELTGRRVTDPRHAAHLCLAVETIAQRHHSDPADS